MYFPTPMYRNGVVVKYGPRAYYSIVNNNRFEGPKYVYDEENNKYYYLQDGCIMKLYYSNNDTDIEGTLVADFNMPITENLAQYYWWIKETNPPPEELEKELREKVE